MRGVTKFDRISNENGRNIQESAGKEVKWYRYAMRTEEAYVCKSGGGGDGCGEEQKEWKTDVDSIEGECSICGAWERLISAINYTYNTLDQAQPESSVAECDNLSRHGRINLIRQAQIQQ